MNLSLRKVNAIIGLKFQTLISNMSIILTPAFAIAFVVVMRYLMPEVDVDQAGMFFSTGAFLLSFGLIFNIAIAGISMSSSPLAEEKEKNTLRVLMTSSVNGVEYLVGSIIPPLIILTITNMLLIPVSGMAYSDVPLLSFFIMTTIASFISLLIGYVVGIFSQNQAQSALLSMPVSLIFTSVPLITFLQVEWSYLVDYIYTGVLTNFVSTLISEGQYQWSLFDAVVLLSWLVLATVVFVLAYKRNGLDR